MGQRHPKLRFSLTYFPLPRYLWISVWSIIIYNFSLFKQFNFLLSLTLSLSPPNSRKKFTEHYWQDMSFVNIIKSHRWTSSFIQDLLSTGPSRPSRWKSIDRNRAESTHVSTITGRSRGTFTRKCSSRGTIDRGGSATYECVYYSGRPFDVTEKIGISRIHRSPVNKNSVLSPESRPSRNVLPDL